MASNLDYLDPAFIPLEEKVNTYLETEKALHKATQDLKNEPLLDTETLQTAGFEQRPFTSRHDQDEAELSQTVENLRHSLTRLEQEIIALLPTRDEWVKVNLGYGPSRVGAWLVPALGEAPARYELRVVH